MGWVFGVLLFSLSAFAQDGKPIITMEKAPTVPMSDRVLFVVDRSGSMHGDHFDLALQYVMDFLKAPTDAWRFGMIAFNDAPTRWPGKPTGTGFYPDGTPNKRDVPVGWAELPEQADTAISEVRTWLKELGAGGDTIVWPALEEALSERVENLSIVLVSDGLFGRERSKVTVEKILKLQQWRESEGLGRAVIHVHQIGSVQKSQKMIVETGPGGMWTEVLPQ